MGYITGGIRQQDFQEMWVERGYLLSDLIALINALDKIHSHTYTIKVRP
jgi:hypothetical protein